MGKVSIGLRGWRFDESDVFDDNGSFRPIDEMPTDVQQRVLRLTALVNAPCDACWLIHGDENLKQCRVARVVYGEPMAEVVLCATHETDFYYWFHEVDGKQYRGDKAMQDAFHEWFLDGGRAPEEYEGPEHVDTDPEDIPEPPDPPTVDAGVSVIEDRIDLRNPNRDPDAST